MMSEGLENRQYSTKPSAGALRAAEYLKGLCVEAFTAIDIAEIIDRETGVAELSASVAELLEAVTSLLKSGPAAPMVDDVEFLSVGRDEIKRLARAVARVKRSE